MISSTNMTFSAGPRESLAETCRNDWIIDRVGNKSWKRATCAFKGHCVVTIEADNFFGAEKSRSYQSKIFINPTWGQLFACAKASQKYTLDLHHSFFEGYFQRGTVDTPAGPVANLVLCLGS